MSLRLFGIITEEGVASGSLSGQRQWEGGTREAGNRPCWDLMFVTKDTVALLQAMLVIRCTETLLRVRFAIRGNEFFTLQPAMVAIRVAEIVLRVSAIRETETLRLAMCAIRGTATYKVQAVFAIRDTETLQQVVFAIKGHGNFTTMFSIAKALLQVFALRGTKALPQIMFAITESLRQVMFSIGHTEMLLQDMFGARRRYYEYTRRGNCTAIRGVDTLHCK